MILEKQKMTTDGH